MKDEFRKQFDLTKENIRFLLCDLTGTISNQSHLNDEWVSNPVQCLDLAVDWKPEIIVVSFGRMPIGKREILVELSAALKRNSHTKQCPLLALLHLKHRRLIEKLGHVGVDYLRVVGDAPISSKIVREIIAGLGPDDRVELYLETVCPFLHYRLMERQSELTVCGAYRDRMVLGGRRLRTWCETDKHIQCENYLKPRSNPGKINR